MHIQIQHLLKLNLDSRFDSWYWMTNSNTTLVKVKFVSIAPFSGSQSYSNTTLVKVKSLSYLKIKLVFGYSNTTLVKVK